MPTIDLQSLIVQLTGHASAGGLIGGIAATALGAIATNMLGAAATSPTVLAAANPLGLKNPFAAAPAAAPVAPVAATHTVTLAQATALGWIVNGVANLPAGVTISG